VWAPHADGVAVAGSFDGWATAIPLAREEGGWWSADLQGVGAGTEYRYVLTVGDQVLWRTDPWTRLLSDDGNSVVVDDAAFDWQDDHHVLPSWNEVVVYELHVGTFGGTLDGCVEKLDHLVALGVNVVALLPVAEFFGTSGWGYEPTHPFAVQAAYGGPDALKRFVREAHRRGLAVVFDVVYNHFGPFELDLWRFDGWSENDRGGIWFYQDPRCETPWGETRPDYGRPEVRGYIRDNVHLWLQTFRGDGLRWDGTVFVRRTKFDTTGEDLPDGWSLLAELNDEIRGLWPNLLSIAEDLQHDPIVVRSTSEGGLGFSTQWDAAFLHAARRAVRAPSDAERDLGEVCRSLTHRYSSDAFARVVYSESHDACANGDVRVPEEVHPGQADDPEAQARAVLAAALVCTAPGIPMLFQGQEFGAGGSFDTDPMPWHRAEVAEDVRRLYAALVGLRRNGSGVTRGLTGSDVEVLHCDPGGRTLAWHRWREGGPGDDVVVLAQFGTEPGPITLRLPRPGRWVIRLATRPGVPEAVDTGEDGGVEILLPAASAVVLSQDPSGAREGS
jgi:1,4-alpha-glucan branching enzyme